MATQQEVARLIIRLEAQTAELSQGLKSAQSSIDSFASRVKPVMLGIAAAVGVGLSLSAIRGWIVALKDSAAEIANVAQKTGVSSDTLSKFASAADKSLVSTTSLGLGMMFLNRNVEDAIQKTGESRTIFNELGISLVDAAGKARPTGQILLDLSDVFNQMGDTGQRSALALKLFGQSGTEMIPFLAKGREEIIRLTDNAEKMGNVIDADLGEKSRKFTRTFREADDAIHGVGLTILREMLPAMQKLADLVLGAATAINSLRQYAAQFSEAVLYLSAVALPALFVGLGGFALVAKGLSAVGAAVSELVLLLQSLSIAALGAALTNPLVLAALALAALGAAFVYSGRAARAAARETDAFVASVRSMDLTTAQSSLESLRSEADRLFEALRKAKDESAGVSLGEISFAGNEEQIKVLEDALGNVVKRIDAVSGRIDELNRKKVEPKFTEQAALDKLQGKINELRSAYVSLSDPVAGARLQFNLFIEEIRKHAVMTDTLKGKISEMIALYDKLTEAQFFRASAQAAEKAGLQVAVAEWEASRASLQRSYENGLVDLDIYYKERERLTREQANKEIEVLQAELARGGLTPQRRIEIAAGIEVKKVKLDADVAKELEDRTKAIRELEAAARTADLSEFVSRNDLDLARMAASYEDGIVSIREFFRKRREIIAADAKARIETLELEPVGDPKAQQERANKIAAINATLRKDNQALNRDEVLAVRKNVADQFSIITEFADLKLRAAAEGRDTIAAQNALELAQLDEKHAQELQKVREFHDETVSEEDAAENRKYMIRRAMDLQDAERQKLKRKQDREAWLQQLHNYGVVATGLGDIFGQIYEESGKKMKAFFFAQKAMAVAEAYIQTALAATKAIGQLGPFGIPMASILWAMGMANIGIILAQTLKGFRLGGPITSGSGTRDDVPALLTRGEYVQPVPAVRYYGLQGMEVIRRRIVPREVLASYSGFQVRYPQMAFAEGGAVSGGGGTSFSANVVVNIPDPKLAGRLEDAIRDTAIRVMKEYSK